MDGTSPGCLPVSLGTVWVGEINGDAAARGPQPGEVLNGAYGTTAFTFDRTVCGSWAQPGFQGTSCYAPCGCWVGAWWGINPPPRCPTHADSAAPFAPMMPTTTTTAATLTFTSAPPLSDSDVERIARRVVELLAAREGKP